MRCKFLILDDYHLDTLYECEDPWLYIEAKRGLGAKKFGKHWNTLQYPQETRYLLRTVLLEINKLIMWVKYIHTYGLKHLMFLVIQAISHVLCS